MTVLPPNAAPLERDLEDVAGRRIDALPAPLRDLWSAHACPASALPALAWQLSVDTWSDDWPLERRRAVVAGAVDTHRRKGTLGAVRRVLDAAGHPNATITEGFFDFRFGPDQQYGAGWVYGEQGSWAEYAVDIETPITPGQAVLLRAQVEAAAPARCHLRAFTFPAAPWVYAPSTIYGPDLAYFED